MIKFTALLTILTCLAVVHSTADYLSSDGIIAITRAPLGPATTNIPQPESTSPQPKESDATTKSPPTRPPRPDQVVMTTTSVKPSYVTLMKPVQASAEPETTTPDSPPFTFDDTYLDDAPESTSLPDCGDPKVHATLTTTAYVPIITLSACNAGGGGGNDSCQPIQLNVTHKSPWGLQPAATAMPINQNVTHESPWGLSTASHALVKMSTPPVESGQAWHPLWAIGSMLFLPAWPLISHKRWRAVH